MQNAINTPVPGLSETVKVLQSLAKKNPFMPDFTWFRQVDFEDEPQEIALEITYFRERNSHGCISERDPGFDCGEVTFGDANIVGKDGKLTPVVLTELELEAATDAFWNP
jgi:hypothetical protein